MKRIVWILSMLAIGCGGGEATETANNGESMQTTGTTADTGTTGADGGTGETDMGGTDGADLGPAEPVDASPLEVMDRPVDVVLPDDYDSRQQYPLLLLLHGYQANAALQDFYFGTSQRVNDYQYILAMPEGTENPESKRFWNAYWCCDFYGSGVDDVAYLTAVIEEAKARFNVDPNRIYFLGHSNGGFMSYRMACDVPGIAAIASLAGSGPEQETTCDAGPVSILQVHGTNDSVILYDGTAGQHPSAPEMTRRWAARNGCDADANTEAPKDLIAIAPGAETVVETWSNCDGGSNVALWTIEGGTHIPSPNDDFKNGMLEFLFEQQLSQ